jgi:hypothetical protein
MFNITYTYYYNFFEIKRYKVFPFIAIKFCVHRLWEIVVIN